MKDNKFPSKNTVFQKYRKFNGNEERVRSIIKTKKLYAPKFTHLNDYAEGIFYYPNSEKKDEIWDGILGMKNSYGICSFSCEDEPKFNPLLWAHYADESKGIMINFTLGEEIWEEHEQYILKEIEYGNGYPFYDQNKSYEENAVNIMVQKNEAWSYEKEYRVFVRDGSYVPIEIKSVVLGFRFGKKDKENWMRDKSFSDEAKKFISLLKENKIEYKFATEYYNNI